MTVREATSGDAAELQAVFNENTKIDGWCVSGADDLPLTDLTNIIQAEEVLVHVNQSGQIDGWISWTENAVEPQVTTLTVAPSRQSLPLDVLALLCLRMCEALQAKGHSYVIARLNPAKTFVIRFLFAIGGTVRWKARDQVRQIDTEQMMEFQLSTVIPLLQRLAQGTVR